MKITGLKLRSVSGIKEFSVGANSNTSRQVRPLDIYPEYQATSKKYGEDFRSWQIIDGNQIRLKHIFLQIETDEGITGMSGPLTMETAYFIHTYLKPLLIGIDPIASEKIWDIIHRAMVRGSSTDPMFAISYIDIALWDLKGRWLGQPIYRLIGGPTRPSVPAYSSVPDANTDDMGFVREHARKQIELGFKAQKWFFHYGPGSGCEGVTRNVELARTVRETVGDDYVLMFDAWQSWSVPYAIDMLNRIAEFKPFWVEECAMIDRFDSYKRIKEKSHLRLSGGEHTFSRWGIKRFLEQEALDVLQPDMTWAGGLPKNYFTLPVLIAGVSMCLYMVIAFIEGLTKLFHPEREEAEPETFKLTESIY